MHMLHMHIPIIIIARVLSMLTLAKLLMMRFSFPQVFFVSVGIVTQELCCVNRLFVIFCGKTRKKLVMRGYSRKIQRNQLRCPGFGRLQR